MREILFRAKTKNKHREWIIGLIGKIRNLDDEIEYHIVQDPETENIWLERQVDPSTLGQYTGQIDKNGEKIFEGDIVQYINSDDFDCQSIVKFGEYKQDGSGGEYGARKCLGFYVDVDNFTCPDWCEDDPDCFPRHMWQQNILEVVDGCEIIGNIYDNPELLSC